MNYSDYDSDGYSSNDDADYVPTDDNLSEDDMNECEREDPLDENDDVPHGGDITKKKRKGENISMRKRKKGCLQLKGKEQKNEDGAEEKREVQEETEETGKSNEEKEAQDEKQKQKANDLWASFLSDVGSRPKIATPSPECCTMQKTDSSTSEASPSSKEHAKASADSKVTITKVFDFAGEEVLVTKEVAADSKEAKSYLKSQNDKNEKEESSTAPSELLHSGFGAKRTVGMVGILGHIRGKKQKMSTLEKSKLDWDAFKDEEGISEELAIHNRGKAGYVERKNFLERVDQRQFQLEKSVRLSNMKQ
ncbi:craniofacial development protein 1 [Lampris incognitus]|uniref:craniofacial development protein 1 n=1 Tax=Lampris incognitus TaxID=2546036 RepID=UPI0024B49E4C|nr:craniofacial development protein 1 [Lampris incognitus]